MCLDMASPVVRHCIRRSAVLAGCVPRSVDKEQRPPFRHQGIRSGDNLRVFENLAQTLVAVLKMLATRYARALRKPTMLDIKNGRQPHNLTLPSGVLIDVGAGPVSSEARRREWEGLARAMNAVSPDLRVALRKKSIQRYAIFFFADHNWLCG